MVTEMQLLLNKMSDNDELELVAHMNTIVPEFFSNSSRFELLDR